MDMDEFLSLTFADNVLRKGQVFYNTLFIIRPDLASKLTELGIDPFYDCSKLDRAIIFVKENW